MPKQKKNVDGVSTVPSKASDDDSNIQDSQHSSPQHCSPLRDETPIVAKVAKKRPAEQEENDFNNEMQKMLESFGADITKTLSSKRKRLEQLTQNSLKSSNKKVDDIFKLQQSERSRLYEEYTKQLGSVIQQWEVDVEKIKDQEEKLTILFKQQQKLFQQSRIVQSQRLKTIKQLHEQFTKGMDDLEKSHQIQQSNAQNELKKEMFLLQKKILMDTQQQEVANVRKSLQTMLF
ncbi:hypothetical protein CHS0354_040909 [Potamilus streckersoni]|uniref:XLR/SYCP3/FAM9 domain-containing protein n=1 Tax=Potamilus streckersoni TaxID=2493646 RepID=A0AAE0VYY0_9BIVA|nr:hypothetical protein CHS0354_040909 [Potamilus streckersoni]